MGKKNKLKGYKELPKFTFPEDLSEISESCFNEFQKIISRQYWGFPCFMHVAGEIVPLVVVRTIKRDGGARWIFLTPDADREGKSFLKRLGNLPHMKDELLQFGKVIYEEHKAFVDRRYLGVSD